MSAHDRHPPEKPDTTEAELREQIRMLREALLHAPERYVIQHHGYDQWHRTERQTALDLTED